MCISRILSVCLVIVCLAAATAPPAVAELIANGDFEAVTAGQFDGWTYSNPSGTAAVSTAPEVIGGINSARMLYSGNNDGLLEQVNGTTELADFAASFDFAVLTNTNASWDTLGVAGRTNSGTSVWAVGVGYDSSGNASLRYHTPSGWVDTGLDVSPTVDINGDRMFDDGESPHINHLTLVGRDFGTSDAELTLSLTGGAINGSFTAGGTSGNPMPNNADAGGLAGFALYGTYREIEFLADNMSALAIPEPSTFALLAVGCLGLLGCSRRRRK